ncbi:MAG TPA: histidine kinase, partial [Bacteroidia bacterium]|nr:histidine kinase [Bacteroidia bacterium]
GEQSLTVVKELPCKINRLKCDNDGKMWACTDSKGIVEMEKGKIIRFYNSADGLASDICYDIAFDDCNRAWVGTNKGLCCIDLSGNQKTKTYNMSHGLISNEISRLAIMRNELYVNTPKGLCVVDVNQIHTNKIPPPVYITDILENNKSVGKENRFTYGENNFTFILEAISYQNPSGILYMYRLSGLDTTWRSSNTGEITFNNLDDGNYKLEAIAINSDGTKSKSPATYIFTITPPFWKTIWFFILEFLFLCGAVYGIILWRTRIIRKKESEKTALNKMIAEYQMSAIRAKMNPHFIFNAINSIQNYILDNNTQYAYDYLAKFSKLIRQVLVNSEHNLITLQTELEMLAIYIELEQRRFSNKFEYEIVSDEKIPLNEIKIPTLLIQPFVENAIWHGIMNLPKTRTGKLSICISSEKNELLIEIKDNGIGRKESTLRKNGNGHKSMGILLSQKRMEILKAIGNENIIIEIVDLFDEQQIASGTLVKIILFLTN